MFMPCIFLVIYALSVLIGLAYPTFMEGVSQSKGQEVFIKTSKIEETQYLFFFWPAYIILAILFLIVSPLILVGWVLRKFILFLGNRWGKRQ